MSLRTRPRSRAGDPNASSLTSRKSNSLDLQPTLTDPPTYVVNLDLPPRSRWNVRPSVTQESEAYYYDTKNVALAARNDFQQLRHLFSDVIDTIGPSYSPFAKAVLPLLLRRVYSREETQEMKGIASIAGLPLHLVIAFNTFLDMMMGCTSGTAPLGQTGEILHFRTLDWDMEELRPLVIQVEFIRGGSIAARAVTYAGYTGILTGVRPDLSISLNYRAHRSDRPTSMRLHQILVLMGFRRSVSSVLRNYLLSPGAPPSLDSLRSTLPVIPMSACYLTFSDGKSSLVFEKALDTAVIREPLDGFIVTTNLDDGIHALSEEEIEAYMKTQVSLEGQNWLITNSKERRCVVEDAWRKSKDTTLKTIVEWVKTWPVKNESTHFACVMSPSTGSLLWVKRWKRPPRPPR